MRTLTRQRLVRGHTNASTAMRAARVGAAAPPRAARRVKRGGQAVAAGLGVAVALVTCACVKVPNDASVDNFRRGPRSRLSGLARLPQWKSVSNGAEVPSWKSAATRIGQVHKDITQPLRPPPPNHSLPEPLPLHQPAMSKAKHPIPKAGVKAPTAMNSELFDTSDCTFAKLSLDANADAFSVSIRGKGQCREPLVC